MKRHAHCGRDVTGRQGGDFTNFISLKQTGPGNSPGAKSLQSRKPAGAQLQFLQKHLEQRRPAPAP